MGGAVLEAAVIECEALPRGVYSVAVDAVRRTNFITSSARHRCVCFDRLLLFTCVSVCIGAGVDVGVGVGLVCFCFLFV